jgi:hypothetical protein
MENGKPKMARDPKSKFNTYTYNGMTYTEDEVNMLKNTDKAHELE